MRPLGDKPRRHVPYACWLFSDAQWGSLESNTERFEHGNGILMAGLEEGRGRGGLEVRNGAGGCWTGAGEGEQVRKNKRCLARGTERAQCSKEHGGGGMCRCPGAQPCVMTVTYQAGGGGGKLEGGLEKT